MRNLGSPQRKFMLRFFVFWFAFSLTCWMGNGGLLRPSIIKAKVIQEENALDKRTDVLHKANPRIQIQAVSEVQQWYSDILMAEPGIVGTGTGVSKDGRPAIFIFAESYELARAALLPASIETIPVIVKVTGKITALKSPRSKKEREKLDPTARFPRPIPIGISTGHPNITAGTIGCRVTDGTNVYALSNNHIYADENRAWIGSNVLQPGPFDGGVDPDDAIGTLYDFEPIDFSPWANNTIDAALVLSSTAYLGNATPAKGYGIPKIVTVEAAIGQRVMKYGRTTSRTKGRIWAINATVNVIYDSGIARFVNQIIITPGRFSGGGDSGSLIVAYKGKDARKPIGLLFAGSETVTVANPILSVLNRFGVTIDGE